MKIQKSDVACIFIILLCIAINIFSCFAFDIWAVGLCIALINLTIAAQMIIDVIKIIR